MWTLMSGLRALNQPCCGSRCGSAAPAELSELFWRNREHVFSISTPWSHQWSRIVRSMGHVIQRDRQEITRNGGGERGVLFLMTGGMREPSAPCRTSPEPPSCRRARNWTNMEGKKISDMRSLKEQEDIWTIGHMAKESIGAQIRMSSTQLA